MKMHGNIFDSKIYNKLNRDAQMNVSIFFILPFSSYQIHQFFEIRKKNYRFFRLKAKHLRMSE